MIPDVNSKSFRRKKKDEKFSDLEFEGIFFLRYKITDQRRLINVTTFQLRTSLY